MDETFNPLPLDYPDEPRILEYVEEKNYLLRDDYFIINVIFHKIEKEPLKLLALDIVTVAELFLYIRQTLPIYRHVGLQFLYHEKIPPMQHLLIELYNGDGMSQKLDFLVCQENTFG